MDLAQGAKCGDRMNWPFVVNVLFAIGSACFFAGTMINLWLLLR